MAKNDFETSISFAIFILLIIFIGPKAAKIFYPSYENIFSSESFKSLMIFMVLYVSNKNIILSVLLTGIFVIIMNLIREKNEMFIKTQENFDSYGPPLSDNKSYSNEQTEVLGAPFYSMYDRNEFVNEAPYYKPSLDCDDIDMNTVQTENVIKNN